ncbi:MAG: ribonuclease E/G [Candidatus Puniceispirillum sp.]|nr:ribonuclease E/G [Candidatus Pelagibacter sp.]MBA4283656.1 ribonuclease E/G [Candidatus Puniceispirillum sp.]
MVKRLLIDAAHKEEIRVAVVDGQTLEEFDSETTTKKITKGNIYLAKVIRVEPSLQAAFVEYSGNRHGFLPFSEIHPDYYKIPVSDREEGLFDHSIDPSVFKTEEDHFDNSEDFKVPIDSQDMAYSSNDTVDFVSVEEEIDASASLELPSDKVQENIDLSELSFIGEVVSEHIESSSEISEPISDHDSSQEIIDEIESSRKNAIRRGKYRIQEVIKRRQILLVQVVKEERGNKGAALTTYLSLPGRYCVLMPNSASRSGGVSRKISDGEDRRRLKDLMKEFNVPTGMALIVRTAGKERNKSEIKRDYEYLQRLWDEIKEKTLVSNAPDLIYSEGDLIKRALRDIYDKDISEILISGDDAYKAAKHLMKTMIPSHAKKVRFYKDSLLPLLQKFNVEDQIEKMHEAEQRLPSGGSIVINFTEALVAVDVNSGRSTRERHIDETAFKTNMEAAFEIARQMRLRDLGGLIVIDFIDMHDTAHIAAVEKKLRDFVKNDRAKIQIGRISQFGLLELSRQRLRPSLFENHTVKCTHCEGKGFVRSIDSMSLQILREIEKKLSDDKSLELKAIVPHGVDLYLLNQKRANISEIENRYGCVIYITRHETAYEAGFLIECVKKSSLKENITIAHKEPQKMDNERHLRQKEHAVLKGAKETIEPSTDEEKILPNPKKRRRNNKKKTGMHPLEAELSQTVPSRNSPEDSIVAEISDPLAVVDGILKTDPETEVRKKNRRSRNWKQRNKRDMKESSSENQDLNVDVRNQGDHDISTESIESSTKKNKQESISKTVKGEKEASSDQDVNTEIKQPRKKWLRRFLK